MSVCIVYLFGQIIATEELHIVRKIYSTSYTIVVKSHSMFKADLLLPNLIFLANTLPIDMQVCVLVTSYLCIYICVKWFYQYQHATPKLEVASLAASEY